MREVEACTKPGQIGALLRREVLYSSLLTDGARAHEAGALGGLERPRGRPKDDQRDAENAELCRRLERAEVAREGAQGHRGAGNVSALLGELLEPRGASKSTEP